jgi:hypothetical protein
MRTRPAALTRLWRKRRTRRRMDIGMGKDVESIDESDVSEYSDKAEQT